MFKIFPSALLVVVLLVAAVVSEAELPPRLEMEFSTNWEMIDWADVGVVEDAELDEFDVPDVSVLSRFWYADVRLDVTLSEAAGLPMLASS